MSGRKKDYRNSPKMNGEPNVKRGSYKTFHAYTGMHTRTYIHTHMHKSMYTNGEQSLLEGLKGRRGLGGALLVFSPGSQDRRWQVEAGGGWVQPVEQSPTRGSTQVGSPRSQTPQVFPLFHRNTGEESSSLILQEIPSSSIS